jgi:hypothetical protein
VTPAVRIEDELRVRAAAPLDAFVVQRSWQIVFVDAERDASNLALRVRSLDQLLAPHSPLGELRALI